MMDRYLLCPACHLVLSLHKEDIKNGLQERRVAINKARRPPGLARVITVDGHRETQLVRDMQCDACAAEIPEGTPCTAVTHWLGREPERWEREYGESNG